MQNLLALLFFLLYTANFNASDIYLNIYLLYLKGFTPGTGIYLYTALFLLVWQVIA